MMVLENDLRNLATETRRKYPESREAAERAMAKLRAGGDGGSTSGLPGAEEALRCYLQARV